MAGISDKAIKTNYAENKYRYNDGTEIANKEFSDGSGLEMYETNFRMHDPQLGRFWQIDPFGEIFEDWSLYSYAFDNPVVFNDPLGLAGGSDSTSSKSHHHHDHHPKPKYKELAAVTIVGYKKDCKTCGKSSPTVNVGPPPSKPIPFNFINWPNSTPEERSGWGPEQNLYFDRQQSGAQLIQGGESDHYLNSLPMYKQWTQSEQEYRAMQVTAVVGILGPLAAAGLTDFALGDMILEGQQQAFVEGERFYNIAARDLINAVRYGLKNRLTIDQIIRLDRLANEYKSLDKAMKNGKQIYNFYRAIQKALNGH